MTNLSSNCIAQIKYNNFVIFFMILLLLAPIYSYYMAVSSGQQDPFPHAAITNTACHYPQDILFRLLTIPASFIILIAYHCIFKWIKLTANGIQYPGSTYQYMYWPSILSVFGIIQALATIDGAGIGSLHIIGAIYYFVLVYALVSNVTVICYKMRQWDTGCMQYRSLMVKVILASYLFVVWNVCLVNQILQYLKDDTSKDPHDNDIYIVIAEWNLWYVGFIWILSFWEEFKNTKLGLYKIKK